MIIKSYMTENDGLVIRQYDDPRGTSIATIRNWASGKHMVRKGDRGKDCPRNWAIIPSAGSPSCSEQEWCNDEYTSS